MISHKFHFIGTGNAWPLMLASGHPFYNPDKPEDSANSAYLLEEVSGNERNFLLIDAGHGTIPFLLKMGNHLPAAVVITHAHMDHILSLDWIAHSYVHKYGKDAKLPVYCSFLCFRSIISVFPQLKKKLDFRELFPGGIRMIDEMKSAEITAYPVYHGSPATGAMMLRIDLLGEKKILLTGDVLFPMLRPSDLKRLENIPVFIADATNRYPSPGSNHWSIIPHDENGKESTLLSNFRSTKGQSEMLSTHLVPFLKDKYLSFFDEWITAGSNKENFYSIYDFCSRIKPDKTYLVHYGGGDDKKYYSSEILSREELGIWANKQLSVYTNAVIPVPGDTLDF